MRHFLSFRTTKYDDDVNYAKKRMVLSIINEELQVRTLRHIKSLVQFYQRPRLHDFYRLPSAVIIRTVTFFSLSFKYTHAYNFQALLKIQRDLG